MSQRRSIFISHATPEDSEFTIWLGAKLAAVGYDVWADVLRLIGGDDWQRKLEGALRDRAAKVLLVANERSVAKQGVRNEIQIATDVGRKLQDPNFIIPLRLSPFEAPFLIAHAQYIDFSQSWAEGLHELLEVLENEYKVPRDSDLPIAPWASLRSFHGKQIIERSEQLISNWVGVRRTPDKIFFYRTEELEAGEIDLAYPKIPFRDGFFSCEEHALETTRSKCLCDALESGWSDMATSADDMRKIFANIANQGLDLFFRAKGFSLYEMANGRKAWWFGASLPDSRISFQWKNVHGSRQLRGYSKKRKVHWHFGVTASFRSRPILHVRLKSRLVFSEDASTPLSSKPRMHRLRRSFAKGWRNARWRDMLLAFLFWISGGETIASVALAANQDILIELPTITYLSPVSTLDDMSPQLDTDDPDLDFIEEELEDEGLEDEETESTE